MIIPQTLEEFRGFLPFVPKKVPFVMAELSLIQFLCVIVTGLLRFFRRRIMLWAESEGDPRLSEKNKEETA